MQHIDTSRDQAILKAYRAGITYEGISEILVTVGYRKVTAQRIGKLCESIVTQDDKDIRKANQHNRRRRLLEVTTKSLFLDVPVL